MDIRLGIWAALLVVVGGVAAVAIADGRGEYGEQPAAVELAAARAPGSAVRAPSAPFWTERGAEAAPLATLPSFNRLAGELMPSVVSIQVEQTIARNERGDQTSPFDFFFPGHPEIPPDFRNRGVGSGVVIQREGLILTNAHVVEDAETIEVTIGANEGEQRVVQAKVLGVADVYDVALIQTTEKLDATVAPLGDSDALQVGDWVMAIGNPFGLAHSASVGIISAKQRRELAPSGREGLYDYLQTDASINPGNSGGPLVNVRGEVIGINAAVNVAGQGIGFAIPINLVKSILPQLKEKGSFSRSWIGVRIQQLTPELSQTYGLDSPRGALVAEVVPNGPAAKAGVREGDVILQFDGKDVLRSSDLPLYASMAGVGNTARMTVLRDGERRQLQVQLGAYPREETVDRGGRRAPGGGAALDVGRVGLVLGDLTPQLRQELGVDVQRGAVVTEVAPGSAASSAGLIPGDVLMRVGGSDVASAADAAKRIQSAKSGELLRLQVAREGGRLFIAMRVPKK